MYGLEGTEREPTDEEIKEAARLANASTFIEVSRKNTARCNQIATNPWTTRPFLTTEYAHEIRNGVWRKRSPIKVSLRLDLK